MEPVRIRCPECLGAGVVADGTIGCQVCGVLDHSDCWTGNSQTCPTCHGERVVPSPCSCCNGAGGTFVSGVNEWGEYDDAFGFWSPCPECGKVKT